MARPIRALVFLLPAFATCAPARGSCFPQIQFSQVASGNYHYVLLPSNSQATSASLVGRFWQAGAPAVNQGTCDETPWLQRCGSDCVIQSDGPAFFVDGNLGTMQCASGCPQGQLVLLLEDRQGAGGIFLAARVDETPGPLFDFSRLGVDLRPIPIPRPQLTSVTGGIQVQIADPAPGFYGLPGIPATGTITAFRVLSYRGSSPPANRTAWTPLARFPYSGGTTTGTVPLTASDFCPSNDPRPLHLAVALELDGQVLTDYVSLARSGTCLPERWYGGGHVPEGGSEGLQLARSAGGELTLTWGGSCVTPNSSAVYEGVLGEWTSHAPRTCNAPSTTATFLEPAGSAYYLVVPVQLNFFPPDVEGSYGLLRDGSERPAGAQRCFPDQGIVDCP